MLKFLIFLGILIISPFFLMDASSLEIEIQKESDRIIDSMGWLRPDKIAYQEQIQIIIDDINKKNRISISMLSTDPNDIRFPDYIENIANEPRIISFMLTNQFACIPTQIDRACIVVDVKREGLGKNITEIRENTREISDKIVGGGVLVFNPEFISVTLYPKTGLDGNEYMVSRAMYTINKQPTDDLFLALSSMLISADIRDAGGFYNHAKDLSKNMFSTFSISLQTHEDKMLRTMQITLPCSDTHIELVDCPKETSEKITRGDISPLDFIQVENITRSELFWNQFLPFNSIIHVMIFSENDSQVESVNSSVIEKLQHISDIQENGWFFSSKSGTKIDGRYIFAEENLVNKNDLSFSIGSNSGESIKVNEGGGCLIATAAFGSELAPQVQFLRELRDNTVLQTESGTSFMAGFNQFYYSFSPAIADYERENPAFKEVVKITLTPLLTSLTLLQYADIDSESEMLGYGIGIILLNIGMYFIGPAILIMKIKKQI